MQYTDKSTQQSQIHTSITVLPQNREIKASKSSIFYIKKIPFKKEYEEVNGDDDDDGGGCGEWGKYDTADM